MPEIQFPEIIFTFTTLFVLMGVFWYFDRQTIKKNIERNKKETSDKLYEISILKELGERIGYSLNVENIIEVITGSLNQFIEYSAVSYILLRPEKLIFKTRLEKSVSRNFLDEVKNRMVKSLSALTNSDLSSVAVEEVLSGALLLEDADLSVNSYFNIPLVIADELVGILTIADHRAGLYKEEEMTILYKLTNQASKAVSRLQEIVRVEQGKLNSMVESMSEGVIMTDQDYRLLVVNPAAKKALGTQGEISIFNLIQKMEGRLDIRGRLEESIKLDKILEFKNVVMQDERFYQILITPVKNVYGINKGQILGCIVVFRDTTKEKELEDLRKDFTSMMVHELRSPIDGINKIADLIIRREKDLDKNKIVFEYAPLIRNSASEMLRLVNNLLDASKIEAGKYEVFKTENNLQGLLKEKVSFYQASAESAGVELSLAVDQSLPEKFLFDRNGISEVITNLLSNAIKFSNRDSKIKLVTFLHNKTDDLVQEFSRVGIKEADKFKKPKMQGDYVCVAISDTGRGIEADKISQLFNKFKQLKNVTEMVKGTGLGLFITKGIIEGHRGEISVYSEEGEGSIFFFTLPLS